MSSRNNTHFLSWLLVLSATMTNWSAEAQPASPAPATILLITVDTLRPDALGFVAGKNSTPAIDRLASEGFAFPAAVSHVPITLPSHTSILSALLPPRHGVRDNGQMVGIGFPLLAEILKARGYATAAFVSGFPLAARFGLDRGFDHYDDTLPKGRKGFVERDALATTEAALAWLETAKRPCFVWVHYYDPHDPYEPPRAFWQPGLRGAYDGEVQFVDSSIGRLRAGLADQSALTILTADHGEGLGEHQEHTHGFFIYDSTMRVPLIFHWPGRIAPGTSQESARLIDVAPTMLDLVGFSPLADDIDGSSLRPLLAGRPQALGPAYLETQLPWRYFGWAPLKGLIASGFKLIAAPRPELFDLERDRGETRNLYDEERRRAAALVAELRSIEARPQRGSVATGDLETVEKLRALGYVGTGSAVQEAPRGLPDPKDRIAERELLLEGEAHLRAGRPLEALRVFEKVLARDSQDRSATLRSGVALLELGRLEAAAARLEQAVRLDPERAEGRYALADALSRLGKNPERAAQEWMEFLRLQPRRAEAWVNLATVLLAADKAVQARDALQRALELEPELRATLARDPKFEQLVKEPGPRSSSPGLR